jgi:ATP diphosphatase
VSSATKRLLQIMVRLRDPDGGCAWGLEQTLDTIAPHTIEEAYEVAEAIETKDLEALKGELGDLLFQVVFLARIAEEAGAFDYEAVANAISDKMVKRHPHVFSDATVANAAAQTCAWEELKAHDRLSKALRADRLDSALDGVTSTLPALTRAIKLQNRAARVGFDWPSSDGAIAKLREETDELVREVTEPQPNQAERILDEVGDLLFSCVNVARKLNIDPEQALRQGNAKFERRFCHIESQLAKNGQRPEDMTLTALGFCWEQAKNDEEC